ncbi:LAMI_0E03554g1_1 [Lachancea mirantina]|uniref:tRNA wybutosine-synthesizing protein 2 n=1 Tax=Lachancea mirantina TaxID=1230905 RepID=A0A1G4JK15_9SACH|nr:LAMI_0E03554g1_1 [Lachancea mirantina]
MTRIELIIDDARLIKAVKTELSVHDAFIKPIATENGAKIIKTALNIDNPIVNDILKRFPTIVAREYTEEAVTAVKTSATLAGFVEGYLRDAGVPQSERDELLKGLPVRYTVYTPLVLFNHSDQKSFRLPCWQTFFARTSQTGFFEPMLRARFAGCTHIAVNEPIVESDVMRRPFNIVALYGSLYETPSGASPVTQQTWDQPGPAEFSRTLWCHIVQNGIHQCWAPMFTMFSRGNVKEKRRILESFEGIEDTDVVDLYAGIGYFTLSYLRRRARRIFCFELNPWSIEGLRRGVALNSTATTTQCHIYAESNVNCPQRLAQFKDLEIGHINLGLLPTSKQSWPIAIEIILNHSVAPETILHIHENVHIADLYSNTFERQMLAELKILTSELSYTLQHTEKIKTFAPDVWHVCFDVLVTKNVAE